ncbi:hypothetical protein [Halogranum gelatinilyticum]|nr:hypothetical protein [Halogranum gelatinilyticum]
MVEYTIGNLLGETRLAIQIFRFDVVRNIEGELVVFQILPALVVV